MKKRIRKVILLVSLLTLSAILYTNITISKASNSHLTHNIDSVEQHEYAMVFGTSKIGRNGKENAFYANRIQAVNDLYQAEKIKYIILSGDHQGESYSEVRDMKTDLIAIGIPDSIILIDPKGFDTYASIKNLNEIAKGKEVLIVSQKFQLQRGIFIAQHLNYPVKGYCAEDVSKSFGFLTSLREHFARLKMWKDIWFK